MKREEIVEFLKQRAAIVQREAGNAASLEGYAVLSGIVTRYLAAIAALSATATGVLQTPAPDGLHVACEDGAHEACSNWNDECKCPHHSLYHVLCDACIVAGRVYCPPEHSAPATDAGEWETAYEQRAIKHIVERLADGTLFAVLPKITIHSTDDELRISVRRAKGDGTR